MKFNVCPESPLICSDLQRVPASLGLADELAGRHLLLTGCTGFFGKWLLALLYRMNVVGVGVEVTVVSRNPSRFLTSHPRYRDCSWLHWLATDVRELELAVPRPIDLIIHAAADTSAMAHKDPVSLFDSIVFGARRVLDLAVSAGAKRILFTGSGAQYGSLPESRVTEEYIGACVSNNSGSAYGEAKRAQETLGAIYAKNYGVDVVMTRCFAFSGPGLPLDGHFAIGNFIRDALWEDEVLLKSAGRAVRSYLHGADLAGWLLTILMRGESGQAYNVGSDQSISVGELAHKIVDRIAPGKSVRILGKVDDFERNYYVPDISKARRLGLDVWTSLDDSINSMAEWARHNGRSC